MWWTNERSMFPYHHDNVELAIWKEKRSPNSHYTVCPCEPLFQDCLSLIYVFHQNVRQKKIDLFSNKYFFAGFNRLTSIRKPSYFEWIQTGKECPTLCSFILSLWNRDGEFSRLDKNWFGIIFRQITTILEILNKLRKSRKWNNAYNGFFG